MTGTTPEQREVSTEQVEVHWQHPRHELEQPVLLVWPNPLRENWAAEVLEENRARIVVREVLVEVEGEDEDTEIEKFSEQVDICYDQIPKYVEDALLEYEGNYGPVDEVINQVNTDTTEIPTNPENTLNAFFDSTTAGATNE